MTFLHPGGWEWGWASFYCLISSCPGKGRAKLFPYLLSCIPDTKSNIAAAADRLYLASGFYHEVACSPPRKTELVNTIVWILQAWELRWNSVIICWTCGPFLAVPLRPRMLLEKCSLAGL